jgi:hypothetical protein
MVRGAAGESIGMDIALIAGILRGTPQWVFAMFVLLLVLGLRASRPRLVGVPQLLATPAAFVTWGIVSLLSRPDAFPLLATDWLICAVAGAGLAATAARLAALRVDRAAGRVWLAGSWMPLARNMAIFAAKYGLGVAIAMHPDLRGTLSPWDIAVSGASAGYFIGWAAKFVIRYRSAPALEPA